MSDVAEVKEALEDWVQEYVWLLERHAPKVPLAGLDVIVDAARRWVRVVEEGEREWRCIGEAERCGPHSFLWRDETHDRCGWRLDAAVGVEKETE